MTFPELFDRFSVAILPLERSTEARLRFQDEARYASARSGDALFTGSDADQVVFVASGSTKLVAHASHGREQVVAFHFAGDLILVPARAAHAYAVCALEGCEFIYFPAREFLELARFETGMVEQLLDHTMQALARCREKTITLGRKSAQERVATFLVTMAERIGVEDERGGCVLDLTMSRRDIADSLGLTIETVSRQLSQLRSASLLETHGRSRIVLLDLPSLNARAGRLSGPE
ncbi:helix-turn-helix domain-containing protein [uncultured Erythrobacter sp.]|uniref:helix-turn-helix domain-containing protein n=1 Tax=uncultured Erythrobacter sp. TaxID=263913 RepID=UPI002636CE39|nr:helix-turn-helix domain-containing protein [uncultured Erythrobacter sp.]